MPTAIRPCRRTNTGVYPCNDSANPDPCPNPDKGISTRSKIRIRARAPTIGIREDGYGSSYNAGFPPPYTAAPVSGGGSYSNCSDPHAARRASDLATCLHRLQPIDPRCEPGHYYLLNNYNPGYFGNGKNAYIDQNPANTPFTIPPSSTPSIGDDLNAKRHFLEILRRPVEQLRQRSLPAQLRQRRDRRPTSIATSAIRSSTTRPSCRTRIKSRRTSRIR